MSSNTVKDIAAIKYRQTSSHMFARDIRPAPLDSLVVYLTIAHVGLTCDPYD